MFAGISGKLQTWVLHCHQTIALQCQGEWRVPDYTLPSTELSLTPLQLGRPVALNWSYPNILSTVYLFPHEI